MSDDREPSWEFAGDPPRDALLDWLAEMLINTTEPALCVRCGQPEKQS